MFSGHIRYSNIKPWMICYLIPCIADMQRPVPVDWRAATTSYWVMSRNTAIWVFLVFRVRAMTELTYFDGRVFHGLSPTPEDTIVLLHSGNSFVSRTSISGFLSLWHRIYRTLLTLDYYYTDIQLSAYTVTIKQFHYSYVLLETNVGGLLCMFGRWGF